MASPLESTRPQFGLRPGAIALAIALTHPAAPTFAGPQGGAVQAGSATLIQSGVSRLDVVQSSPRAVINWRSFGIGATEHVNFVQPSAAAATLNRVVGAESSEILGRLTANGTVFLINPNGILIGPGARIDVGSLIAATADISNENFMAGRYHFDRVVNRDAVIVNRGEITAAAGGLVALVAPGVENSGIIRAQLGKVALASGNAFTLDLFGDKLISFAVDDKVAARLTDTAGRPLAAYVNQAGVVEADGGSVLIAANAAQAVVESVVNVSGVVRATSFEQRNGEIVLHGGDAGAVRVAGTLDVSGKASGQSGGGVHVLGADVALESGGRIDASGEARGGTVEVSGTRSLAFAGDVDVSARSGTHGTLLLDPDSLTIDAPTANAVANVLRTGASEVRMAADTITVEQPIDGRGGAAGGDLTLEAGNRIAVNNDIITTDGKVFLKAGEGGIAMSPEGTVTQGTIIHTGSASIQLTAGGDITAQHLVTTGPVTIVSSAGSVEMKRDLGGTLGDGVASLRIDAANAATLQGVRAAGPVTVQTTVPDAEITLAGPVVARGAVTIGNTDLAEVTNIRLRNDIHTSNADIVLNGRTWVDPIVQPGDTNVSFSNLFRLSGPPLFYEVPVVQVSLQTDGSGNVRFNGDILWGGDLTNVDNRPQVRYLYNVALPLVSGPPSPEQIAAARSDRDPAATGYFGLNVGVREGAVHFGGNLGMYTMHNGKLVDLLTIQELKPFVDAPQGSLGSANNAAALLVAVRTPSYSYATGKADVTFSEGAEVKVGRFQVSNPDPPGLDSTDVFSNADAAILAVAPGGFAIMSNRGLPRVRVSTGGPNLIGPSPRNVAAPANFASIGPLPEIPVGAPLTEISRAASVAVTPIEPLRDRLTQELGSLAHPEATTVPGAFRANDLNGRAGLRHRDATQSAPLVRWAGRATSGADPDYFSQELFEFVQWRSRRAATAE